jgi:hypothetical protein
MPLAARQGGFLGSKLSKINTMPPSKALQFIKALINIRII